MAGMGGLAGEAGIAGLRTIFGWLVEQRQPTKSPVATVDASRGFPVEVGSRSGWLET